MIRRLFLATAFTVAMAGWAHASPVIPYGTMGYVPNGVKSFAGTTLDTATSVTIPATETINNSPATYLGQPNIFVGLANSAVTVNPLTLSVSNINGPVVTYNIANYLTWGSSGNYEFSLDHGNWTSTGASNLSFVGFGTFHDTSATYADSSAYISLSFTQASPNSAVNFSGTFAVPPPPVPEPSTIFALCSGAVALGLYGLRRKFSA